MSNDHTVKLGNCFAHYDWSKSALSFAPHYPNTVATIPGNEIAALGELCAKVSGKQWGEPCKHKDGIRTREDGEQSCVTCGTVLGYVPATTQGEWREFTGSETERVQEGDESCCDTDPRWTPSVIGGTLGTLPAKWPNYRFRTRRPAPAAAPTTAAAQGEWREFTGSDKERIQDGDETTYGPDCGWVLARGTIGRLPSERTELRFRTRRPLPVATAYKCDNRKSVV